MEAFYFKINRLNRFSPICLKVWLEVTQKIPSAKVYLVCDNQQFTDYCEKNFVLPQSEQEEWMTFDSATNSFKKFIPPPLICTTLY